MTGDEYMFYCFSIEKRDLSTYLKRAGQSKGTPKKGWVGAKSIRARHNPCSWKGVTMDNLYYENNCLSPTFALNKIIWYQSLVLRKN